MIGSVPWTVSLEQKHEYGRGGVADRLPMPLFSFLVCYYFIIIATSSKILITKILKGLNAHRSLNFEDQNVTLKNCLG